jgi:hypothetical protein
VITGPSHTAYQASVRTLAHGAAIDFDVTYSEQPTVRLANLFLAVSTRAETENE